MLYVIIALLAIIYISVIHMFYKKYQQNRKQLISDFKELQSPLWTYYLQYLKVFNDDFNVKFISFLFLDVSTVQLTFYHHKQVLEYALKVQQLTEQYMATDKELQKLGVLLKEYDNLSEADTSLKYHLNVAMSSVIDNIEYIQKKTITELTWITNYQPDNP